MWGIVAKVAKVKVAKVVGAVLVFLVSVTALIISLFSYNDQHAVDTAAALASEEAYATKVSYWREGTSSSYRVIIQDRSLVPISDVTVVFSLQALPFRKSTLYQGWRLRLVRRIVRLPQAQAVIPIGTIPPCTIATTDAVAQAQQEGPQYLDLKNLTSREKAWIRANVTIGTEVEAVDFTDANGVSWQRNYYDILTNISTPSADIGAISYTPQNLSLTAANACS